MIFNVNNNSSNEAVSAESVKYGDYSVAETLDGLKFSTNFLSDYVTGVDETVGSLVDELTANGKRIYLDYKDGKYGYNTDALRGADTFSPFKSGGSDSEVYANLTTVNFINGDVLPTITGCGYMILRRTANSDNYSNILNVYIDGSTKAFPVANLAQYTNTYGDYWKFYFQKSISFSGGKNGDAYFYQTLLADSPVDEKYNITQGGTVGTDYVTINGRGYVLLSPSDYTIQMYYRIDNATKDTTLKLSQYHHLEIMFNESFTFKSNSASYVIAYIAYVEK